MIIKRLNLSACLKKEECPKVRKLRRIGCSFSVISSGEADVNGKLYNQYGIQAKCAQGSMRIDYITTERGCAEGMVRYLNINKVSAEHFHQVVEEILCGYHDIGSSDYNFDISSDQRAVF